jgi:hypothetical protein
MSALELSSRRSNPLQTTKFLHIKAGSFAHQQTCTCHPKFRASSNARSMAGIVHRRRLDAQCILPPPKHVILCGGPSQRGAQCEDKVVGIKGNVLLCSSLSLTSAPSSLPPHAGVVMTFLWPPFLPACARWRPSNPGAKARWSSPIHDVVRGLNPRCRLDPHYQQPMEAFPDSIYAFLAMSHNMPCQLIRATGSQVKPSPTRSTPSPPWARRSLSRLDLCRVACSMCPSHRFESPEMTRRLLQLLCHLPDSWLGSCLFLAPLQYLVFPVLSLCICFFNFIMFGWNTYYWV